MIVHDFKYNNSYLSEFNCMMCSFDGVDNNPQQATNITFNTVIRKSDDKYQIYSSSRQALQTTIQICKSRCNNNQNRYFSKDEIRDILIWLDKKEYSDFYLIDTTDYEEYCYEVFSQSINIIKRGGLVYGFEINLTTSKPYASTPILKTQISIKDIQSEYCIVCDNDEKGYIYPSVMIIQINEDGDFALTNSLDNRDFLIKGCVAGEVITIDGNIPTITSSIESHKIYNDFNFNFFRLIKNDISNVNMITCSLKSTIKLEYRFVRKVGFM